MQSSLAPEQDVSILLTQVGDSRGSQAKACSPRREGVCWVPAWPSPGSHLSYAQTMLGLTSDALSNSIPVWQFIGNQYWIFCIMPEVEGKDKGEGRQA